MKKYWKIEGRDGLWVHDGEAANYRCFRQGNIAITLPLPSHCPHRPATFEEIHWRAKPPTLGDSEARSEYEEKHGTWYVHKREGMWVTGTVRWRASFDTHAEAIAYAQKHAHE